MKFFRFFLASVLGVIMTSCFGDTNNTVTQDFSAYCLSYVIDINTGESVVSSGATYKVVNNLDNGTLDVEISGVKMPNGTYMAFDIKDKRFSYNEKGAMTLNVPATSFLAGSTTHTVTDFKLEFYSRYLGNQAFPMLLINYTIDNQYFVRVIYNPSYYWGTTTVTDQNGNVFTNSDVNSFYGIQFDIENNKADFAVFGSKFAEGMPSMNMMFKGLDYTFNAFGYTVTKDEIIPTIGETPYPSYKITDFKMQGNWGGIQYISFTCTIDTEKLKGQYRVEANVQILPPTQSSN